ncbi:MAG: sugar phosphate isomerase/epimerase [Armatimonadetes bacterium]|nr:sugar phosphate isomerase/epimerase [Armatimonadota bacterium]
MEAPKIGCNTLYPDGMLGAEETFTTDCHLRALDTIADAGFDAVEYSHPAPLDDEGLARVANHTAELGLISWSLHAWMSLPGTRDGIPAALEAYADSARRAKALGVRVIVVHSSGGIAPETLQERRKANTETLVAFSEMVGPDITIAVENMTSRADWEFLVPLVREVALPNVGLNIDTGHANLGDMNVVDCIRLGGDLIRTTHLQDNHGARDDHLPPGLGTIDWLAAIAAFREVGYRGVYMVEITDCPYQREVDPRGDTFKAARNLRGFLEATG